MVACGAKGGGGEGEPDGVTVVRYIIGKLQRDHFPVVHPYLEELEGHPLLTLFVCLFVGLAYHGKDIVFRFIIEYSSLRDFGP
jgi:hypothetical protein